MGLSLTTSWLRSRIEDDYPPLGRFIPVEGVRLHVLDVPAKAADAPVLLILHGAACSLRDPYAAFAPALDGRMRMIFVDRPGHGYSGHEEIVLSGPAAQARLAAGVLEALGIERAIVVGHSFGGAVAAAFAVHHPERTAGLVMIAPATHPWPGGIAWSYDLVSMPVVGSLLSHTIVTPLGLTMIEKSLQEVFAPEPVPRGFAERAGVPLTIRPAAFRATSLEVSALKDHLAELAPLYRTIAAPTTVVTGDADGVVPTQVHAARFAAAVKGARHIELAGAGHMPHHTRTADVVAAIEAVVERAAHAGKPRRASRQA